MSKRDFAWLKKTLTTKIQLPKKGNQLGVVIFNQEKWLIDLNYRPKDRT